MVYRDRKGPAPLTWIVAVLVSLLSGLGVGVTYYHAHSTHAAWPLVACGGAIFVVFAGLCSTTLEATARLVYLAICLFGLGVGAVGFGIMYTH